MKRIKILQSESEVLRAVAEKVPVAEINSKQIKDIVKEMRIALDSQQDGVAIAAPQIGHSLRIFLVSGKIFETENEPQKKYSDLLFINPEIVRTSKKKKKMEEGCLSVRWLYGEVPRSDKITIQAYDAKGKKVQVGAAGLLAQIFQHEIDHLNGILFIDKAENIREILPNEPKEN